MPPTREEWKALVSEHGYSRAVQLANCDLDDIPGIEESWLENFERLWPNWQPIETAPTDGTVILLYCGRDSMFLWRTGKLKNDEPRMMTGATHWMPLPAAPTHR